MKYAEVVWLDAHGGGSSWAPRGELRTVAKHPKQIVSVGQVVSQTDEGVILVLSFDEHDDNVDSYIFVPAACIVSFQILTKGRK